MFYSHRDKGALICADRGDALPAGHTGSPRNYYPMLAPFFVDLDGEPPIGIHNDPLYLISWPIIQYCINFPMAGK